MTRTVEAPKASAEDRDTIDLKDPAMAALLAWLVPGLGHWYQERRPKAALFFVCIMGTFIAGLILGEGRVVYAAWQPNDHRLAYAGQAGAGLVAMPALVQAIRYRTPGSRDFVMRRLAERPPQPLEQTWSNVGEWFMAPPVVLPPPHEFGRPPDELDDLHKRLNRRFELGTVLTLIAGLLNILVIYDAWGGPAYAHQKKAEVVPA